MEKKAPNEMEMAAKEDEEREKAEKAAQGRVSVVSFVLELTKNPPKTI